MGKLTIFASHVAKNPDDWKRTLRPGETLATLKSAIKAHAKGIEDAVERTLSLLQRGP